MKRNLVMMVGLVILLLPFAASAETWKGVSLMDAGCAAKMADKPDSHTRSCALRCAKAGYGILTGDGTFIKFDDAGNKQAFEALQASEKKDHLRVTVEGELDGETLNVATLTID
ncbi:MAG TPA: hypothetical protein VMT00_08135 [Thermoanaerobaculia bacterium]|nr:hypothetical protein [Thermoanaerobaculia bacterium]